MGFNRKPFYGWWIVFAGFYITLFVGGAISYSFTAIFEPIAEEFGWSYTQVSIAASIRGLEVGLLTPVVGMLADRWGPRRLILVGTFLVGLGMILLSRSASLGVFYGAYGLLALGISACTGTVLMTAVANWFRKRVAMATGIMICGFGVSGFLVPAVVLLIDTMGWRPAMFYLGLVMWITGVPLSLLFRHKPEQYGYVPDGQVDVTVVPGENPAPVETADRNIGARQALKSRAFWHITIPMVFQYTTLAAVATHVMPYLSSVGIARSISSLVASGIPVLSIGGRLGFGWIGDRMDKRWVITGGFVMMSLGMLSFSYAAPGWLWLLVVFNVLLGVGYGGNHTISAALIREYFGRGNFGTIHGFMFGLMALGSIIGAPAAGWVFDTRGSYQSIWLVYAALCAVSVIILITAPSVSKVQQMGQVYRSGGH